MFDVQLPEDDLKKIETFRCVSVLYVKLYILILVYILALCIELSIKAGMWMSLKYTIVLDGDSLLIYWTAERFMKSCSKCFTNFSEL